MQITYILRRILIFIPTLFAISVIAFVISINAPGDPVENFFEGAKSNNPGSLANDKIEQDKQQLRHELGLDLPVFYFTLTSLAEPDSFKNIGSVAELETQERLLHLFGNSETVSHWRFSLLQLEESTKLILGPDSASAMLISYDSVKAITDHCRHIALSLQVTSDTTEITSKLQFLKREVARFDALLGEDNFIRHYRTSLDWCEEAFDEMKEYPQTWKNYVPCLHFYGYNQYHRWLFGDGDMFTGKGSKYCEGVIRGDFGKSYINQKPVSEIISRSLPWSAFFTIVSVILAYLISIPLGVQAAAKRGSLFDRGSSVVLFMLYSMPQFLMGIVLLVLFANPDMWNIFPSNGVEPAAGIDPSLGWWDQLMIRLPYFVLPIICYTYSSLAFLSRTTRVAMLEISSHDFMRTARAKGLTDRLVYYRHGLRNALLPIITVFANVFPAAIGGSVVLEYLFGIPGMGPEILTAVQAGDFSMIVAVFTITGFMTLVGYLVADILYSFADPRISFEKK